MEQKTFLVLNDQNEVIRVFVVNHSEYLSDTSYRCVCPVNGSESFLISQKNIYLDDIHNFTRLLSIERLYKAQGLLLCNIGELKDQLNNAKLD